MTERELKRLSRAELLEELFKYANSNAELQLRLDNQQEEMKAMQAKMQAEIDEAKTRYMQMKKNLEREKLSYRSLSKKLSSHSLDIQNSGNIAEATLKMTGIFETAQKTADLYVKNVRDMADKQEKLLLELEERSRLDIQQFGEEATRTCIAMRTQTEQECLQQKTQTEQECLQQKTQTEQECLRLKNQTEQECLQLKSQTAQECDTMKNNAISQAEAYWQSLSVRLEDFYNAHQGMKELFADAGISIPAFRVPNK